MSTVSRESRLANVMTRARRKSGHAPMKRRSTTRKNKNPVIGGNRMEIVHGAQEIPGKGSATASPFGVSVTVEVTRRQVWTRPSNTCSFSFNDETMPGNPLVNSDTRGTINRITRTMIRVTAAHQQQGGQRAGNAQRLESPGRRPQHDSDHERRHDRQHDFARDIEDKADSNVARIASDHVEICRRGSPGSSSGILLPRDCGRRSSPIIPPRSGRDLPGTRPPGFTLKPMVQARETSRILLATGCARVELGNRAASKRFQLQSTACADRSKV